MKFIWSSISLETYGALLTVCRYEATDKIMQDITALSMITGKPEQYFSSCSLSKLSDYREALHKLLDTAPPLINDEYFTIGRRKFYTPKSIDQYYGQHLEDVSALGITEANLPENYTKLLAAISTEVSKVEHIKSFGDKVSVIEKIPASIGVPLCDRFLTRLGEISQKFDKQTVVVNTDVSDAPDFRKHTVSMFEHWGFFHVFFELSGRDRTKMDYWRKQTIPYIFSSVAHRKDLIDEESTT